jgi:hypothetical protein
LLLDRIGIGSWRYAIGREQQRPPEFPQFAVQETVLQREQTICCQAAGDG